MRNAASLSAALKTIYAILNRRAGVDNLVEQPDRLTALCLLLETRQSLVTRLVWEVLTVICVYSKGVGKWRWHEGPQHTCTLRTLQAMGFTRYCMRCKSIKASMAWTRRSWCTIRCDNWPSSCVGHVEVIDPMLLPSPLPLP